MPPSSPPMSSTRNKGKIAKGRTLLLVAVCASLTPSTSAFTVGPVRGSAHIGRASSSSRNGSALSSSPNEDGVYFFTAPPQPFDDDEKEEDLKSKTITKANGRTVSAEQTKLEPMEVPTNEEKEADLQTKTITKANGRTVSAEQTELETMKVPTNEEKEADLETKTITKANGQMVSVEQTELETSEVPSNEEKDLLSTIAAAEFSFIHAATSPALAMDVDGNGTGALMKRSPTAGGVHAPLMATNPSLAFPIDSGKEGMQAKDTRAKTRKPLNDGIINQAQPQTRLVRYSLPPSTEEAKQGNTRKSLVLKPASIKNGMSSELAPPRSKSPKPLQPPKPRLVRYNGPDVEHSTDHDGMELPSVRKNRNRELKLERANLVLYNGASQQKRITEEVPHGNDGDENNTKEDYQKGRKALAEDPGYANRYTGLSDFNLARKTGLTVNKPISLWVERDKFL